MNLKEALEERGLIFTNNKTDGKWHSPDFELSELFEIVFNYSYLKDYRRLCTLLSNYNVISNFNYPKKNKNGRTMTFKELNNNNQYQPLSQETADKIVCTFYKKFFGYKVKEEMINKDYLN